jgi:hypothetical protein
MAQIEWDYYLSPDISIYTDGSILAADQGKVYSFHDNNLRALMSFTGWGMPPIEYITQRGPYQHGITLLDYRLNPRIIQLVHRRVGGCREDYWDNRSSLIDVLRPNRGGACLSRGRLRKILGDGAIRDIYVMIESGPVFSPRGNDWDEWSITETLRFIAHDPIIFDPARNSASWTLSAESALIFPITFPIFFGGAIINDTLDITYVGSWLTYPEIVITGPLNGPVIENESTDETISIGWDVPSGKTLTINLGYGVKTVTDSDGINRIGTISTDSDLATFHIAPDPEVAGGVNTLRATGSGADANTAVVVTFYDRFIGI